jgi:hypothetical protein
VFSDLDLAGKIVGLATVAPWLIALGSLVPWLGRESKVPLPVRFATLGASADCVDGGRAAREVECAAAADVNVDLVLQAADPVGVVGPDDFRVPPGRILESRADDLAGQLSSWFCAIWWTASTMPAISASLLK